MLTHAGVFSVDFSRIDTGKTVCFLVSGGLAAGPVGFFWGEIGPVTGGAFSPLLSRVVYVNYSSVSIRP